MLVGSKRHREVPEHLGQLPCAGYGRREHRLEDLLKHLPSGWWGDVVTPGQVFAAMLLSMAVAACGDSGSAQRRAPTTRAAMVLSELFEQADKKNARAGGCV